MLRLQTSYIYLLTRLILASKKYWAGNEFSVFKKSDRQKRHEQRIRE